MATAKQQQAEPEYTVTLRIAGSKIKAMADAAKKIGVAVGKVTSSHPLDLSVHFNNIEFDSKQAHCFVEFEKSHDVKYQGARRSGSDVNFAGDNNNANDAGYEALLKEDKVVWTHTVREINGTVTVTVENGDGTMTEEQMVAALRTKLTATLKSLRLWDEKLVAEFDALVKESADWHEEKKESRSRAAQKGAAKRAKTKPPKTVDPTNDLMKRFRAAKRVAKFYNGMMQELTDGVGGKYDKLRELYADNHGWGDRRYPWAPPCENYELPETEKEFEAQWEKSFAEFDKVLAEGKAAGELTDAPREKKTSAADTEVSEPAKALAAVDGADVPKICTEEGEGD